MPLLAHKQSLYKGGAVRIRRFAWSRRIIFMGYAISHSPCRRQFPRRAAASGGCERDSRFITSALNESDRRDHISSVHELALFGGARFRTVHAVSTSPRRAAASGGRNHDSRFITSALNESDRRDHISSVRELALLELRDFALSMPSALPRAGPPRAAGEIVI